MLLLRLMAPDALHRWIGYSAWSRHGQWVSHRDIGAYKVPESGELDCECMLARPTPRHPSPSIIFTSSLTTQNMSTIFL